MSLWRRAARKDENHQEIVQALRALGASVVSLSAPGVPDLLVGWIARDGTRRMELLEIKRPKGKRGGGGGKLTLAQSEFVRTWRGHRPWVVTNAIEAAAVLGYTPDED